LKPLIPQIDTKYAGRSWPFRVTWRHRSHSHSDPQVVISYRCSVVTKSVYPAVVEIMGPYILRSWPWPFWVTWRHQSRDHSNINGPFPIGGLLEPSLYFQPFSRYWTLSILESRPFRVTWRHRSC